MIEYMHLCLLCSRDTVNWREAIKAMCSGLNNPSIILTGRGSFVEPFRHIHRCDEPLPHLVATCVGVHLEVVEAGRRAGEAIAASLQEGQREAMLLAGVTHL